MTKLEQLREAEKNARLQIEKAEKEAQRMKLSIPDLLNKKDQEKDEKLSEIAESREAEISSKVDALRDELQRKSSSSMEKLLSSEEELTDAATDFLEKFVLESGKEDE
jgi:vacuolar-type H+-ATPase subunit H